MPLPLPRVDDVLGPAALVAILLAFVVIITTLRTGRGAALAALHAFVAAGYAVVIIWTAPLLAHPAAYLADHPFAGVATGLAEVVDLGLFCLASLAALAVAAFARHWRWLGGLSATLLPMGALALGGRVPMSPSTYAQDLLPFSAALFCPLLVGLIYAITLHRLYPTAAHPDHEAGTLIEQL
jgi:hypothetical protein